MRQVSHLSGEVSPWDPDLARAETGIYLRRTIPHNCLSVALLIRQRRDRSMARTEADARELVLGHLAMSLSGSPSKA
jgi:hypothetical protein